jgi:putative MFS transporter
LITLVYIGVSLGSYLQSFSDDIGRSVFIKWNGILQLIFGILSCVATNMTYFIVFRFIYGIGIGIVIPLSATYMSEIAPST